jgi:ubiquinone/menaquinone biosynthesis C-methylase UbiE
MARGPKRWFFDAWALAYDLPIVQRVVYRPPQDAVLAALRDGGYRRVLDVGCGTGQLTARLRRELPGAHVVGCDFSRGMLRQARTRDDATSWVQADAGQLPFRTGAFDAVVSTEAFHWFPEPRHALAEFRRVLCARGRLLLALVNLRFASTGRIVQLASGLVGQPFRWPTRRDLRRLVQLAGFHVDRQTPIHRLPGALFLPPVLTVATVRQRVAHDRRSRTLAR